MATNTEKIVVQIQIKGQRDLDKLGVKTDKATKKVGGLNKSFVKMAAGVLGAAAAFRTISSIIGKSIQTFKDFEFQMAKVKAITGANRTEFLLLSRTAQELGRSTFFTATQVAELQTNYGKLGFTTDEILNAQEATLALATATGSDLARAAIVAGSAVRGFGLDASETGRVTDVMALAFTSSALDIEKWQTSMTKVAPIAKSAGFSIEDTSAIMAQLADSGIEASIAGTSLRNILLKMQDPNSDLVKSFGKTIHSLDDLVPAMAKFSKEGGSLAEIMEIVDVRQVSAFEQMITSRQRTLELRDALKDASGAAEEMARIVGDNLEGALKRSESAWQGFQIAFVDGFGESLKNITDGFANFINKVTDFIETPISEKVNQDRLAMNDLFNALQETNTSQDTRNKLVAKLNLEYGEYLPNIVTEKTNLVDLKKAQVEANAAMLQRISILAAEEKLTEIRKKQIENEIESANLIVEKQKALRVQTEARINTDKRLKTSLSGVDVEMSNANTSVIENTELLKRNNEKAGELSKEYETAASAALNLGVDVDALVKSLNISTENTNESTDAIVKNTKAKEENAMSSFVSTASEGVWDDLVDDILNGTKTIKQAEQDLADFQMNLINSLLEDENLSYEERKVLDDQLTALKLANYKKTTDASKKSDEDILEANKEMSSQKLEVMKAATDAIFTIMSGNLSKQTEREAKKLEEKKDAGLITEEQYEEGVEAIQRKAFEKKKRLDIAQAIINGALAMTTVAGQTGVLSFAFSPFIAAMTAAQIAIIASQKFAQGGMIEEFANGGMVKGKSHAQGGEKFAVGGRVVELEGGEAVINKRSTSMFSSQLSAMNAAGGGVKFADGGLLNQPSFSQQQFNALGQNQMMGAMGGSSKVVVVEADITNSQNTVSVIQSQATI
jgi:TP901 family phage tail tape measure protein